jgi:hypothetical protein
VGDPTVIAVDWSGAKRNPQGLWIATIRNGVLVASFDPGTREAAIDYVLRTDGLVLAGFDFSFGVPAWFAHECRCDAVEDVWKLAERDGETWLAPTPPFWRERCTVPRRQRFRRCEEGIGAKSIFQCVGNGQVGPGSVRGMPLLARLRDGGFSIWPFDAASERTAIEIYPTMLRKHVPDAGSFASNDERDAVCSALVMWRERETIAAMGAAIDPVTRLEGDVWLPTCS